MFGIVSFFVPIAEALFVGYAVAVAVYMALLYVITRLNRSVLARHSQVTAVYTLLHAISWSAAAFAGAFACAHFAPLQPYGGVGFPACLAIALIVVLLRSFRKLPGQMSYAALLLNLCGIVGGTVAALSKLHAFAALQG